MSIVSLPRTRCTRRMAWERVIVRWWIEFWRYVPPALIDAYHGYLLHPPYYPLHVRQIIKPLTQLALLFTLSLQGLWEIHFIFPTLVPPGNLFQLKLDVLRVDWIADEALCQVHELLRWGHRNFCLLTHGSHKVRKKYPDLLVDYASKHGLVNPLALANLSTLQNGVKKKCSKIH